MYCPVSSPSKAQLFLALVEVHSPLFPCDGQPRLSKSVLHMYWQDSQPHLSCICRDVQHLFVAYTCPTINPVSLKSSVLCSGCFGNMWTFTGENYSWYQRKKTLCSFESCVPTLSDSFCTAILGFCSHTRQLWWCYSCDWGEGAPHWSQ